MGAGGGFFFGGGVGAGGGGGEERAEKNWDGRTDGRNRLHYGTSASQRKSFFGGEGGSWSERVPEGKLYCILFSSFLFWPGRMIAGYTVNIIIIIIIVAVVV